MELLPLTSLGLPAEIEARVRELVGQDQRISAIKLLREHTGLGLKEAKDAVDALAHLLPRAQAPQQGPGRGPECQPAQPADPGTDLTERFAIALRQARRRAGDPPYRALAGRMGYSVPTISRAFAGRALPRWDVVAGILKALGIAGEQIAGQWREEWIRALDQRRPIARPGPASPTTAPAHSAESQPRLPGPSRPPSPLPGPDPAPALECEDCGALIGNLVQHQAWHWRIERQLRRSVMRAVDATGQ